MHNLYKTIVIASLLGVAYPSTTVNRPFQAQYLEEIVEEENTLSINDIKLALKKLKNDLRKTHTISFYYETIDSTIRLLKLKLKQDGSIVAGMSYDYAKYGSHTLDNVVYLNGEIAIFILYEGNDWKDSESVSYATKVNKDKYKLSLETWRNYYLELQKQKQQDEGKNEVV